MQKDTAVSGSLAGPRHNTPRKRKAKQTQRSVVGFPPLLLSLLPEAYSLRNTGLCIMLQCRFISLRPVVSRTAKPVATASVRAFASPPSPSPVMVGNPEEFTRGPEEKKLVNHTGEESIVSVQRMRMPPVNTFKTLD